MSLISASLADGISGAAVGRLDRRQWRRGERRGGCRRRCCWIRYAGWLRGLVVVEGGIGIGRLLLRCSVSGSPRPPPAPSRAPLRRQGPTLTTAEAARTEILTRATRRPRYIFKVLKVELDIRPLVRQAPWGHGCGDIGVVVR